MIERYVFLKLSADLASGPGQEEFIDRARRLFPTMEGVESFTIGRQSEAFGECKWHIAMTIRFANTDALGLYMACPIHADFDAELAMSLEDIESWSFEIVC